MPNLAKLSFLFGLLGVIKAQQPEYAQCGGIGWTGFTVCASPFVCTYENDYYFQCLPGTSGTTTTHTATTTTHTATTTTHTTTTSKASTTTVSSSTTTTKASVTTSASGTVRTSPPSSSCLVVRQSGATSGQYTTISAAVSALGSSSNSACIFIYSGTYSEQVVVTYPGKLAIYGYTTNTASYSSNTVTITHSENSTVAGSDDASGTLQAHSNYFSLYNVNVVNSYGTSTSHSQAIAVSCQGNYQAFYACQFKGYQDTLYAHTGTQYFGHTYIEGAVDFIFGTTDASYFKSCTIASSGSGCVTADGRDTNDNSGFVFDSCTVTIASDAASGTSGNVYLGRPWRDYAQVVFMNSYLDSDINAAGWSEWSSSEPNTDHIMFGEYNNTGPRSSTSSRQYATILTSSTVQPYLIQNWLGSTYTSWVDAAYL